MNRKDAPSVVQTCDRVDIRLFEKMPPQRRGSGVGHDPRRQDEPDAPTRSRQLERAFDEELVPVEMRPCCDAIDAGLASEGGESARLDSAARAARGSPRSLEKISGNASGQCTKR